MGLSVEVPLRATPSLAGLLAQLPGATILMVDNQLVSPKVPPPTSWRDARIKTPAGTVTLTRTPQGVSVTIFGNADEALLAEQQKIAAIVGRMG